MEKVDLPLQGLLEQRARSLDDALRRGDSAGEAAAVGAFGVHVYFKGSFGALGTHGLDLFEVGEGRARGTLAPADIRRLIGLDAVELIMLPPGASASLDRSVPEILANQAWVVAAASGDPTANKGAGVLVGIIDTGIDVFHGAFRKADGTTRIKYLWDQTFNYNAAGLPVDAKGVLLAGDNIPLDETGAVLTRARSPASRRPSVPPALNYGAEFTAAEINAALTAHPDGRSLPASLQDHPTSSGDTYHGTHVAGIAAGNGDMNDACTAPLTYIGVAPEADLVIVKTALGRSDGVHNVLDAARYCFGIADLLSPATGPKKPCVINMSFGGQFGAHNGLSEDCRDLDAIMAGPLEIGRALVIAAGNDRDKFNHAAFTLATGASRTLRINTVSDETKLLRIFVSYNERARLSCRVRLPPGGGSVRQGSVRDVALQNTAETVAGHNLRVASHPAAGADLDRHFVVEVSKTDSSAILTGIYEIDINAVAGPDPAQVHVWITSPSDYTVAIMPRAGDPESPQDADRHAKRPADWISGTLLSIAACRSAITVAAYNDEEAGTPLAPFSSQGPAPASLDFGLYNPAHVIAKPDIAAPGMGIHAPRGMRRPCCLECDCCVGRYVDGQGTSMAAPHITGVVALMFAQNPDLTATEIKAMLKAGARPAPTMPPGWPPPAELWGSGKVDAVAAVAAAIAAPRLALAEDVMSSAPAARPVAPARPLSIPERLQDWTRAFGERPAWNLFAALVSLHVDEVKRLIDTNWRVGTVWQRYGGPRLVRSLVLAPAPQDPPVPAALGAPEPRELFRRLAVILLRYGSPALKADIEAYRPLLDAVPGASWDELDSLASAGPVP